MNNSPSGLFIYLKNAKEATRTHTNKKFLVYELTRTGNCMLITLNFDPAAHDLYSHCREYLYCLIVESEHKIPGTAQIMGISECELRNRLTHAGTFRMALKYLDSYLSFASDIRPIAYLADVCRTPEDRQKSPNSVEIDVIYGISSRAESLIEYVRDCVYSHPWGKKKIAAAMGKSCNHFMRKVNHTGTSILETDDLQRYMLKTQDFRPISFLVDKYKSEQDTIKQLKEELKLKSKPAPYVLVKNK